MTLMEKTEKFFINSEVEAENLIIERKKNSEGGDLIDYKVSEKETKDGLYYIVVLKTRYATLTQCKESI